MAKLNTIDVGELTASRTLNEKKSLSSDNEPKRIEFLSRKFFLCCTNSLLEVMATCPLGKIIDGLWNHLSSFRAVAVCYSVLERCPYCHFGQFP